MGAAGSDGKSQGQSGHSLSQSGSAAMDTKVNTELDSRGLWRRALEGPSMLHDQTS